MAARSHCWDSNGSCPASVLASAAATCVALSAFGVPRSAVDCAGSGAMRVLPAESTPRTLRTVLAKSAVRRVDDDHAYLVVRRHDRAAGLGDGLPHLRGRPVPGADVDDVAERGRVRRRGRGEDVVHGAGDVGDGAGRIGRGRGVGQERHRRGHGHSERDGEHSAVTRVGRGHGVRVSSSFAVRAGRAGSPKGRWTSGKGRSKGKGRPRKESPGKGTSRKRGVRRKGTSGEGGCRWEVDAVGRGLLHRA